MLTAGTLSRYSRVRVILSHAGGTLPFIVPRMAVPLDGAPNVAAAWMAGTTGKRLREEARRFYFDLTLGTAPETVDMLLKLVDPGHILYGVCTH